MAGEGGSDADPSWRVTGWRRWSYAVVLVLFLAQTVFRLVGLAIGGPPRYADGIWSVLWLLGALCYAVMSVALWRTRVTLLEEGVEIRAYRTKVVPWARITRAYRSRWNRGTVMLDLVDAEELVLPAPTARPKDPAPELDEAVDLINARAAAIRPGVGDGGPG